MNEKRKGKKKKKTKMMKEQGKYIKGRRMGPLQTNGSIACSLGLPLFKGKCNRHMQNCVFLCSLDDFLLKM